MMPKETQVAKREPENIQVVFNLPPAERVKQKIAEIDAFQELVRRYLKPGLDYGVIPGTGKKPTLLKPGAEKVDKLLDLSDNYEIIEKTEDWNKPFFNYLIRCELRMIGSNILVSSGLGSCNSLESKYRYRWLWPSDVPENKRPGMVTRTITVKGRAQIQYRTDNDDICSQVNTVLKMGKKRAHIDATLSAARLSELFTQDIEDMVPEESLDNDDAKNDQMAEQAAEFAKKKGTGKQPAEPPPSASQPPQNEQGTALKPEVVETITAPPRPVVEHTPCKNIGDFLNCCFKEFGLVKGKAIKEAGYARQEDISDPEQAYQNVKAGQEKAP